MRSLTYLFLLLLTCFSMPLSAAQADLVVVEDGHTDYSIVLPSDATSAEKFAAEELASHVKQMSGADLKTVDDSGPMPDRAILLGGVRYLNDLGIVPDWAAMGKEGYLIKTVKNHLIIAGARPRGTMYGVYDLLEKYWGCRWFTFDTGHIPSKLTLSVPELNVTYRPVFDLRAVAIIGDTNYGSWFVDHRDVRYVARSRWNFCVAPPLPPGGSYNVDSGPGHNYRWLVSPDVYAADHPEYYALHEGKRRNYISPGTFADVELCLSNPEVANAAAEFLAKRLREHPDADMVFIGQSDTPMYCKCDNCNAARKKYGGWDSARRIQIPDGLPENYWCEYGGFAGWQLEFVNRVAGILADEFPDVKVGTYAYWYQRRPPHGIKPHKNVAIWYCPFKAGRMAQRCYGHSVDNCPVNDDFENFGDELGEWARISNHTVLYDYWLGTWFGQPVNISTLRQSMRFYRKMGVEGVYLDGIRGVPGGFEWLTLWLWCQLAWNPDFDVEQGIDEFCTAYYGAAAPHIKNYIKLASNSGSYEMTSRPDIYDNKWDGDNHTWRFTDDPYTPIKYDNLRDCLLLERVMKKEAIEEGYRIFEQARKAVADDPKAAQHVECSRMPLEYAMLEWLPGSDSRLEDEALLLIRQAKDLEIPTIGYNAWTYDQYRERISERIGIPIPAE